MIAAESARHAGAPHPGMSFREFVALIALLMSTNALAIDSMLPALPAMGHALSIASGNQRQFIIAAYVLGFGAAQLVYGPLSDRYGRKPVLLAGMTLFTLTSIAACFAFSFTTIIAIRILQGVAAASSRVIAISVVRDCYSGRRMARVMSLALLVLLAVPILAPSIGQIILLVAPWEWIFVLLAAFGAIGVCWIAMRLPETLHPEYRRGFKPAELWQSAATVLRTRSSIGYTIGSALTFGSLMGFINSIQQIFTEIFHRPGILAPVFASVAGCMGVASYLNSRSVEQYGARLMGHGALIAMLCISFGHLMWAASGRETLVTFALLQAATMFFFGAIGSNFGAMAMEEVGHVAGMASSIQGFISTVGGALFGIVVGQSFDGTTVPVVAGFFCAGLGALCCALFAERGKLFQAHHLPPPVPAQ